MRRAALLVMLSLVVGSSHVPPVMAWPTFAVTDGQGRILGMLAADTGSSTPPAPRFGSGIWADTVAKSPRKARPHLGLGKSMHEQGEWLQREHLYEAASEAYRKAETEYKLTIDLSPSGSPMNLQATMNLVGLYATANEFGVAEALARKTLAEHPGYLPAITKLAYIRLFIGSIAERQGRAQDARSSYQAVIEMTDSAFNRKVFDEGFSFGALFSYRGQAHAKLGDCKRANKEFEFAHRLDPEIPNMRCDKGDS